MLVKNTKNILLLIITVLTLTCGSTSCAKVEDNNNSEASNISNLKWQVMYSQDTYLSRIWGSSASDVYCIGYNGLILHYDGQSWSQMDSGTTKDLLGIWGSSSTNVFVVGGDGIVLHFNGNTWSQTANL